MVKLVTINQKQISMKTYNDQRVVTFKDVDLCHERADGTARKRFSDNKKRFIEGVDFYRISPSEFRTAIGGMDERQQNDITLITHTGYMMLVKSFTDDLAWAVQRELVNKYFHAGNDRWKIEQLESEAKAARARAMEMNAKTRALQTLMKTTDNKNLSHIALEVYGLRAAGAITGKDCGSHQAGFRENCQFGIPQQAQSDQ